MSIVRPARIAIAAALLGASVLITGAPASGQTPPPTPEAGAEALVRTLESRAGGTVTIDRDPVTGAVTFVGTEAGRPLASPTEADAGPEAAAGAFVGEFATLFGAASQTELERVDVVATEGGVTSVKYQQTIADVPVMSGELRVLVDGAGDVLAVMGELQPGASTVDTNPTVTADGAAAEAVTAVAKAYDAEAGSFTTTTPEPWIYAPDLLGGPSVGPPRLVWRLDVRGGTDVDELVLIDADTGGVALHFNQVAHGLDRRVCDQANVRQNAPVACTTPTRSEGQPITGINDVDQAYDITYHADSIFRNVVGRDGVDGAGLPLTSVVRHCKVDDGVAPTEACPMANAYWHGPSASLYFGQGYAAVDDIVGHEFTHGVVDFTADLNYYYQSGALNEHIADLFGEFVDWNHWPGDFTPHWEIGEDLPGDPVRDMKNPPRFNQPDSMTSPHYAVTSGDIAGDYGGVHTNSGVGNKAAYLMTDGGYFNDISVGPIDSYNVALIYYGALTTLLGSGSDYADLARALPQACTNLIGASTPLSIPITADNCVQVAKAVDAVRMSTPAPNNRGGDAPGCPPGTTASTVFSEDFESGGAGWRVPTNVPGRTWTLFGPPATYPYATSGVKSLWAQGYASAVVMVAQNRTPIPLPSGSDLIMTFNQARDMEPSVDYGLLELSTDGGTTWTNAGPLFTHGGYNSDLSAGGQGFSASSGGYTGSQLDLSSLAGQNLTLSFAYGADASTGGPGWWIDDIEILACRTANARPDAQIRLGTGSFAGNNIYNTTAASQTRTADVRSGGTANFTVKIQNDGNVTEPVKFRGMETNSRWKFRYTVGTTDITAQVVAGTYQTPAIAPGASVKIKVEIKPKASTPNGASQAARFTVTSSSNTARKDVVQATVFRR